MARALQTQTIETYPEADALDGFLHPRFTNELFGHGDAERQLAAGLATGELHHAWLLTGPEGIGKATLAYRFARAALGATGEQEGLFGAPERLDPDPDAPASHLVRALSHPDLLVIRRPYDIKAKRLRTAITVDEVRRLRAFLGHKQAAGGWKVVIVDPADDLNVNAANALLKSLEEPPARAVFFLISSRPGRLLATIRSRCRLLNLEALGDSDLRQAAAHAMAAVEMAEPDEATWQSLIASAGGSVAKLLALASDDGAALAGRVDEVLGGLGCPNWSEWHKLADELAGVGAAARFDAFCNLLIERTAHLIHIAATGSGPESDVERARMLAIDRNLASWAELWETLVRDRAVQDALNLDRKAYILECLTRLSALATGNRPSRP